MGLELLPLLLSSHSYGCGLCERRENKTTSFFQHFEKVHHPWRYCNTRLMCGVDGASPSHSSKNPFNIESSRRECIRHSINTRTDRTTDRSQKAEKQQPAFSSSWCLMADAIQLLATLLPPTDKQCGAGS